LSLQSKVDSTYQKDNVPGIFVAIYNNNKREYYTAGFADTDTKMVFDSTTVFEIGSITKTFTAYVLMSVLRNNGINDSSFILKHLPDSVQKNPSLQKITFLSLMNHTSGLPRLPGNMNLSESRQPYENYTAGDLF
jgi:CubicO group peptidase (beta-lactamase class C family)